MSAPSVQSNAIVDALLEGLAAIGTPPSSWNTAPPATTESAPMDSLVDLPHQLFLQHVDTQVRLGDGVAIPVNEWVLSHNFAVVLYAKDTKAQPGMVELRKLTDDALRALTAVRDQVEAISGLPFAPARLTNRPDFNHAGFRCAVIEFAVDAIWPGTFVETTTLGDLHELFRTTAFRLHNGDADLETWLNTSVATTPVTARGAHLQVDTGIGANKVVWKKEECPRTLYPHDAWGSDEQVGRMPCTFSAFLCCSVRTNPTATSYIAIVLGAPEQNPAWPLPVGSVNPCVMLRLRLDNLTWELCSWSGDSNTDVEIVPLVGVEPAIQTKGSHVKMVWDSVNRRLEAWVDGVLGAVIENSPSLPLFDLNGTPAQGHIGAGYLFSSGTHAAGRTLGQIGPMLITNPGLLDMPLSLAP